MPREVRSTLQTASCSIGFLRCMLRKPAEPYGWLLVLLSLGVMASEIRPVDFCCSHRPRRTGCAAAVFRRTISPCLHQSAGEGNVVKLAKWQDTGL
jgi:hypothetical protein